MLKFILVDFEAFWWKATGSSRTWWATGDNVLGNVMFNCSLFGGGSSDIGILLENFGKR